MSALKLRALAATALTVAALGTTTLAAAQTTLLNVSYDPTREFYREYNAAFQKHWKAQGGRRRHHPPVARRGRFASPRGDRRPGGRRGDTGAGL